MVVVSFVYQSVVCCICTYRKRNYFRGLVWRVTKHRRRCVSVWYGMFVLMIICILMIDATWIEGQDILCCWFIFFIVSDMYLRFSGRLSFILCTRIIRSSSNLVETSLCIVSSLISLEVFHLQERR